MAYEDQETKHSRVVVETPTTRREVTRTEREYAPETTGTSPAAIAALAILGIAVVGLLGLLFWNMRANSNNVDQAAQQQPTPQVIVQQPAQQPPVIVQQPAPATQQAPIIVNPPVGAPAAGSENVNDDSTIQLAIDKKLQADALFSTLDVTATVSSGKVTLVGNVKSESLKNDVQQAVKSIKGVKSIDNRIAVSSS
jgi:uncharacterized protein HemX